MNLSPEAPARAYDMCPGATGRFPLPHAPALWSGRLRRVHFDVRMIPQAERYSYNPSRPGTAGAPGMSIRLAPRQRFYNHGFFSKPSIKGRNMTFRYIGSKSRLVEQIKSQIGPLTGGFFVDGFCGTGVVAEAAAELGWPVRLNDNLSSAVIASSARLTAKKQATFSKIGGYEKVLAQLNSLPPEEGFIWRSYSPASYDLCGVERRYFTETNGGRIDAIRSQISRWRDDGKIDVTEEHLLIADLFSALNRVANIAGTFGCFLSKWTPQATGSIALRPRELKDKSTNVSTSVGDVFNVDVGREDVVYLDPPYTKRQYASYYHILETVALGDAPVVEGVAGLRPWKDRASDFCYKTRALATLTRLVSGLDASRILLSYSGEGHIAIDDLKTALAAIGPSELHPLGDIGRYRPNATASDGGANVSEYLVVLRPQISKLTTTTPPLDLQAEYA